MRTLAKGCEIRLHYGNKNSEMLQDEQEVGTEVGTEETDFRIKNLLSWQNILSNKSQQNEPIKEKSFVEESVLFTFLHQTNGNHVTEP